MDGALSMPPNLIGRVDAMRMLRKAGGDRVAVYGLENEAGTPIYVHAKVCIVDDTWSIIGSDNFNRRSWTHDSEIGCAVLDLARRRPGRRIAAPARTPLNWPCRKAQTPVTGPGADIEAELSGWAEPRLDGWFGGGRHAGRRSGNRASGGFRRSV